MGFVIHIVNPSDSLTGKQHIEPREYVIIPISIENILLKTEYYLNFRIVGYFIGETVSNEDINVLVMSEDEYHTYQTNGSSTSNLLGIIDVDYNSLKFYYEISTILQLFPGFTFEFSPFGSILLPLLLVIYRNFPQSSSTLA